MSRHYNRKSRRKQDYFSTLTTNHIHYRNSFMPAWWSATFLGLGHIMIGKYYTGFILLICEYVMNEFSHLNKAIFLSMTGEFDKAHDVLDDRWLLMYLPIYVFAIWDSFRTTNELNTSYILSYGSKFEPFKMNSLGVNYLDKKSPVLAVIWSILMPGLANIYFNKLPTALVLIITWSIAIYYSHYLEALRLVLAGDMAKATAILDPQWLLYIPSIYIFAIYDAYVTAVWNNKLYEIELSSYLKKEFQPALFKMPTQTEFS